MTYWTNFAKTGDPNGANLPKWPNYKDEGYPLIHLNSVITSGPDTQRDRYLFLQKGMPPRSLLAFALYSITKGRTRPASGVNGEP